MEVHRRKVRTCLTAALFACACQNPTPATETTDRTIRATAKEVVTPIPEDSKVDERIANLGEDLFHDARLSGDDTVACATCHDLSKGGVDGRPVSIGIAGAKGSVNAPTVFNSAFLFRQFWDGRAASLEDQVDGPVHAPGEMGSNWSQVMAKLRKDQALTARFRKLFADGLTPTNIRTAIATFERSLITPNSPFDLYLRGKKSSLKDEQRRGWKRFKDFGCVACHQGVALGGNMYQRFGIMRDYFADRGQVSKADYGRFNVTGDEADRHVFKVPTLRNVALTAPYFHDGSARTLAEAVQIMAIYQLGRELTESDVSALVAFLESLTGEFRGRPL